MRVPGEGEGKYFAFFGLFFRVEFSGRNPKIEPENITRKSQKIFTNHCPGNRNKNEIAGDRGGDSEVSAAAELQSSAHGDNHTARDHYKRPRGPPTAAGGVPSFTGDLNAKWHIAQTAV